MDASWDSESPEDAEVGTRRARLEFSNNRSKESMFLS